MQSRILGKSGLRVSEIGVGCWAIGGPDWNLNMPMGWGGVDDEEALAGLHHAFELGANFFDTADVYGHGHSERLLGRFLKSTSRDKVVIGTKVGYFKGSAPFAYHPLHMQHQLEMSLNNLQTDYVDIYYLHNLYFGDDNEYFEDAVAIMRRFKDEGKIRSIGQRGPHRYAPHRKQQVDVPGGKYQHFLDIASIVDPDVLQVRYNMLTPSYNNPQSDLFAWAESNNVGVAINKPLGQGLLLDKYNPEDPPLFELGDHRSRKRWFSAQGLRVLHGRLALLQERFGYGQENLVRVALQYCLARSQNAVVVAGFKNAAQIETNLAAAGRYLSEADVLFVQEAMAGVNEEIGSFFDTEENDG